jgi:UDP-GlcNAc3NAcA epimerase
MYDNSLYFSKIADEKSTILQRHELEKGHFILGTIHRDSNTDDSDRMNSIFDALISIASDHDLDIVLPLHPRTSKAMESNLSKELLKRLNGEAHIRVLPPASFLDIIALEKNCQLVMTDSGGLQKEAYYFRKPVIILRPETEWVEIVDNGTGIIADADKDKILKAYRYLTSQERLEYPPVFGDGKAAEFICEKILAQAGRGH